MLQSNQSKSAQELYLALPDWCNDCLYWYFTRMITLWQMCAHKHTRTFSHSCECAHAVWPPADTDTPVVMAWSAERSDVADLTHLTEVLILKILPRDFLVIIISTYKISRCFETCEITRMSKNFSYWSNALVTFKGSLFNDTFLDWVSWNKNLK